MKKILIILLVLVSGCKSTRYVPVETLRIDTVVSHTNRVDSFYRRDSVFVRELFRGDTLVVERADRSIVERIKIRCDTVYVARTDSVAVPIPVEKERTRWEQIRIDVGGVAIALVLLGIIALAVWLVRRFRSK